MPARTDAANPEATTSPDASLRPATRALPENEAPKLPGSGATRCSYSFELDQAVHLQISLAFSDTGGSEAPILTHNRIRLSGRIERTIYEMRPDRGRLAGYALQVASALAAAGTPEALRVVTRVMNDPARNDETRIYAIWSHIQARNPTTESAEALGKLASSCDAGPPRRQERQDDSN
jgi:hypothetical protein